MSRIGKIPIAIPDGVEVKVQERLVSVAGSKGQNTFTLPDGIKTYVSGGQIQVERASDASNFKALHGLARSIINNMVIGVSQGFTKELHIQGVGYRARLSGSKSLELSLGYSHVVSVVAPEGIDFEVPQPTQIMVKGIDKQLVGQVAADIRKWKKPEPYKGKGIRYADERINRKAGKASK